MHQRSVKTFARPNPSAAGHPTRAEAGQAIADRVPAGSTGLAAVYTEHIKPAHVIRKVVLRQTAILNYLNPFRPTAC